MSNNKQLFLTLLSGKAALEAKKNRQRFMVAKIYVATEAETICLDFFIGHNVAMLWMKCHLYYQ